MRHALPFVALALVASPALATGGFECRATDRSGIRMDGVVGHVIAAPLISARLVTPGRILTTAGANPDLAVGRSWLDAREIRIDLVDLQATRFEAQLRVRIMVRNGGVGTLVRAGRAHPVRCTVE